MDRTRINVYGTPSCKACRRTDEFFSSKKDIDYRFYDINDLQNEAMVYQVLPAFKNNSSTPVIQKCVTKKDGSIDCTVVQGFREQDYE